MAFVTTCWRCLVPHAHWVQMGPLQDPQRRCGPPSPCPLLFFLALVVQHFLYLSILVKNACPTHRRGRSHNRGRLLVFLSFELIAFLFFTFLSFELLAFLSFGLLALFSLFWSACLSLFWSACLSLFWSACLSLFWAASLSLFWCAPWRVLRGTTQYPCSTRHFQTSNQQCCRCQI